MSDLILEAAKQYCDSGVRIFVVNGKRPIYSGWQERATSDFEKIKRDIEANPGCGLAIPTGMTNGFDVWDIDGEEGLTELKSWLDDGQNLPETPVVLTGSGGLHFYFKHEPGMRNSAKAMRPGWDTRGDGGYVVAPPSVHPETQKPYLWWDYLNEQPVDFAGGIFAARPVGWPEELLELYTAGKVQKQQSINAGGIIPHGIQEDTLTSMAGTMRRIGMTSEEIAAALLEVARYRCDPPMPDQNAIRIAKSVGSYQVENPLLTEEMTDRGWGRRLYHYGHERAAFVHESGIWTAWEGSHWRPGSSKHSILIQRIYDGMVNTFISDARSMPDNTQQEKEMRLALIDHAKTGRSSRVMNIAIDQAKRFMTRSKEEFDTNPWLFNVKNGTIDLQTGNIREHQAQDMVTMVSDVTYDPDAKCPKWMQFMNQITEGDQELLSYMQRVVGYTMSGANDEQILVIVHGRGGTGKSSFVTILSRVFGEFAAVTGTGIFEMGATSGGGASPEIAKLVGKRMVSGIEVNEDFKLDDALIKNLTGNEAITARYLYENSFTFTPQFTIWIASNEMPIVSASDSVFRRIKAVPIDRKIPESERNTKLVEEITSDDEEMSGILNWCIEGCLAWQREGLGESEKVISATTKYRDDMNVAHAWLQEFCEEDPEGFIPRSIAWPSFYGWFRFNGFGHTSSRAFYKELRKLDVDPDYQKRVNGEKHLGIRGWKMTSDSASKFAQMTRE